MRIHRTLAGALIVFGLLAISSGARADCMSASDCICALGPTILEVRIDALDGAMAHTRISAMHGVPSRFVRDEALTVPRSEVDAVGKRLLLSVSGDEIFEVIRLGADDSVPCPRQANPRFSISANEAIPIALAENCPLELRERGFEEPECRDVMLTPCGCASAGGNPLLLLPLTSMVLLRRRHRASAATVRTRK